MNKELNILFNLIKGTLNTYVKILIYTNMSKNILHNYIKYIKLNLMFIKQLTNEH